MFTGIIESVGLIIGITNFDNGKRFKISCLKLDLTDVKLGDSIAVNGVCLTAIEIGKDYFCADVSDTTLSISTFVDFSKGYRVNLEKALRLGDRLGGHLVAGHVDGVGIISEIIQQTASFKLVIEVPSNLTKYLAVKGSITVDGVSLTINDVKNNHITLTVIPHTLSNTNFLEYKTCVKVNLEVDLIARYLDGLLSNRTQNSKTVITQSFLQQHGF